MAMLKAKAAARAEALESRAHVSPEVRARQNAARTRLLVDALARLEPLAAIALYCSLEDEPGSTDAIGHLHARGIAVLLPVLGRQVSWAWFDGWERTTPSWRGIRQPTTARLGPEALAQTDAIVVPCLAIGLDGSRLGTGGGWYDRALAHRRAGAPVIALAREAELYPTVPTEPHDLSVDAAVTESRVLWFRNSQGGGS